MTSHVLTIVNNSVSKKAIFVYSFNWTMHNYQEGFLIPYGDKHAFWFSDQYYYNLIGQVQGSLDLYAEGLFQLKEDKEVGFHEYFEVKIPPSPHFPPKQ
jgi:hypothetical protein